MLGSTTPARPRLPPSALARPARTSTAWLKNADSVRRPVREERLADDPLLGNWAPVAAVLRVGSVVSHHEVVAAWDRDRTREVAIAVAPARDDVRVLLGHAVADHMPV